MLEASFSPFNGHELTPLDFPTIRAAQPRCGRNLEHSFAAAVPAVKASEVVAATQYARDFSEQSALCSCAQRNAFNPAPHHKRSPSSISLISTRITGRPESPPVSAYRMKPSPVISARAMRLAAGPLGDKATTTPCGSRCRRSCSSPLIAA